MLRRLMVALLLFSAKEESPDTFSHLFESKKVAGNACRRIGG